MPKKLTNDEFVKRVNELHGNEFNILDNYIKYQTPLRVKCNKCGKISTITPNNLLKPNHVCKFCGDNGKKVHRDKAYTTEEYINLAKSIHGDEFDYSKTTYCNRDTDIIVGCKKHGFFKVKPYNHLKFRGCHQCAMEEHTDIKKLTNDEFVKRAKSIHGDKYDYLENYCNMKTKIKIKCKKCGSIFEQTPHKHLNAKHGCPNCKHYKLEDEMKIFLSNNNIDYIFQANKALFPWLKLQSLDFYLPKYNTAIECQGSQHYKSSTLFGGDNAFQKTLERDSRKKKLCEEKGIKLLYFSNIKYNDEIFIDKELLLTKILQQKI